MEAGRILPELISPLYRFSWLLAPEKSGAEPFVARVLREGADRLAELTTAGPQRLWFFLRVSKLTAHTTPAETPGQGDVQDELAFRAKIQGLPAPVRTAAGLFYLGVFDPESIARGLHIDLPALGDLLAQARNALAGSDAGSFCPGGADAATAFSEVLPGSMPERVQRQVEFDRRMADLFGRIGPDQGAQQRLGKATSAQGNWTAVLRQPVVALSAVAALVVLGIVISVMMSERGNAFPGAEFSREVIDATAKLRGGVFEEMNCTAGEMGDWLFMKGMEGVEVPAQFADRKVTGARYCQIKGVGVAQLATAEPTMILHFFRASSAGLSEKLTTWSYVDGEEWSGAVRSFGRTGCIVTAQGSTAELEPLLGGER